MFVTDLNPRERKRFAGLCDEAVTAFTELRDALTTEDDLRMLIALVRVVSCGSTVKELAEVAKAAVPVEVPDHLPEVAAE